MQHMTRIVQNTAELAKITIFLKSKNQIFLI